MNFQLDDGRGFVYQWDTGRVLKLIDFSQCATVNFFNPDNDQSYTVKTFTKDGIICVNIPNELLQKDKKIKAYATGTDTNGQYVQLDVVIDLIPRQKPSDYVYEPTEVMSFESVLAEAQQIKTDTQNLKNETAQIKTETENIKNSTQDIYDNTVILKSEIQQIKTDTQQIKEDTQDIKDATNLVKDQVDDLKTDVQTLKNQTDNNADNAQDAAKIAERYAKGTENGVPVSSGDGYQDNAKYYKEQAQQLVADMENAIELASEFTIIDNCICQN